MVTILHSLNRINYYYYYYYYYGSTALCCDLATFSDFWSYTLSVWFLGRGISLSQGLYLQAEQHKRRINAHNTDIHTSSGIRTQDPSFRMREDSSCLRPRGRRERPTWNHVSLKSCYLFINYDVSQKIVIIILWHAVWKAELKYPLPGNGYELRIRGYI
jgi:hypothetical protein